MEKIKRTYKLSKQGRRAISEAAKAQLADPVKKQARVQRLSDGRKKWLERIKQAGI